jgi:hypothetical protein
LSWAANAYIFQTMVRLTQTQKAFFPASFLLAGLLLRR